MGNKPDLSQISDWVSQHRRRLRWAARKSLSSALITPTAKCGIVSIMDSLLLASHVRGAYTPSEMLDFDSLDQVPAVLEELQAFGHVGSAMSIQESYLSSLGPDTSAETWINEFQRYCDLHQKFRSIFMNHIIGQSQLPCPPEDCLPIMEGARVLRAAAEYFPRRKAKDIFGRTLLHLALYSDLSESIEAIISASSDQDLASKDYFGRTPLHIAATIGSESVVRLLLARGVDVSPTEHSEGLTPLQCGAAAGNETVAQIILVEASLRSHDKEAMSSQLQSSHAFATENGHGKVARLLRTQAQLPEPPESSTKSLEPQSTGIIVSTDGSGYDSIAKLAVNWAAESPFRSEKLGSLSSQYWGAIKE